MPKPQYMINIKFPNIYHPINWDRFGSYCNLSINQDCELFEIVPQNIELCQKCREVKEHESK